MPNYIKYSTNTQTLALKSGNYYIGTGDVRKGPTSTTDYWSCVIPPTSGYTVYLNKASNGPSIYTCNNDTDLINITNRIASQSYTSATQCLVYYLGQNDKLCANIDYPTIVTNGLVLNLDAGFVPSYARSGVTWYDLSVNGYTGTLTNGPTFSTSNDGYISFDGTNDYVTTSYQQPEQNTTTSFTWTIWVYPFNNSDAPIIGNRNNVLNFTKLTSNKFEYYPTNVGGTMPLNTWQNVTIVKENTSIIYYRNGSSVATGTSTTTKTALPFFVGGDNTANEYSNCRIASVQIYHRALTAAEVLQNYNATKSRFGL